MVAKETDDYSMPSSSKKAKRRVTKATFEKWQREFEKDYETMTWLCCEVEKTPEQCVSKLFCCVCQRYEDKIHGMKHFSPAWVTGSDNQKTSNMVDNVKSEQHKAAMMQLRIEQARSQIKPITSYFAIARCLYAMDSKTSKKIQNMLHDG